MLVKICGLTSVDDAVMAAEEGADWIGLNFHPPSPRFINLPTAREIVRSLPETATPVGLFVDVDPDEVADRAESLGLRVVQLHGQEPPEDLLKLSHLTIVRAFRLNDRTSIASMLEYLARSGEVGRRPDAVLVDGYMANALGGTGVSIADELLESLPSHPHLILAGGLNPRNVADRIRRVRPWMVDVASGVESAPGRKDRAAISTFIAAASSSEPRTFPSSCL